MTTSAAAAEALKKIVHAEVAAPLPGSRLSPSGQPLDLWAPSPWHALCATELQSYVGRANRGSYRQALKDPLTRFGRRPFYRGQARAWDIRPSSWRAGGRDDVAIGAFQASLDAHVSEIENPLLRQICRVGPAAVEGLAQHYGLGTTLVDFSLRPLVAVGFACGDSDATGEPIRPRGAVDPRLGGCGVIYVIGAPVLAMAAQIAFDFPPAFSRRLYRQQGLFVEFGTAPEGGFPDDYSAAWTWTQQNCQRIFFPRSYPSAEGCDELRDHDLMDGDAFLSELAKVAATGQSLGVGQTRNPAPWAAADGEMSSEASGAMHSELCQRMDSYLRSACLIEFQESGACFDPLMFSLLDEHISEQIDYFLEMANLTNHEGMAWTAGQVRQARADAGRIMPRELAT